mgnify:CR=1 FL=1
MYNHNYSQYIIAMKSFIILKFMFCNVAEEGFV